MNKQKIILTKSPVSPPSKTGKAGYEYLSAYQLGKVIQHLTHQFCQSFLKNPKDPNYPNLKLIEQMNGAARSNPQNIAEGYTHESLKGYIYLIGIAHGSNEELAKDYEDFLRQRNLPIWGKDHPKIREFRGFRARWLTSTQTSPKTLNTPSLPNNPTEASNMMLTLCNMEGFLLTKLSMSLKQKHKIEGGLTEKLYRERRMYRGY